jgi:predicted component of type VI protein secretion system
MAPILELVEGRGAGRTFTVGDATVAGRDSAQPIAIADDDQVSRRHARFELRGDEVTVEDLNSRNGTYVNGQVLQGRRVLAPGDRVRMGLTVLELRSDAQVAARASAVRPQPAITEVPEEVLQPAAEADLPPPPPEREAGPAHDMPALRAAEVEPAFVPDAIMLGEAAGADREGYDRLAALVDGRVKRQTNVAAFALLAVAALVVIVYLGAS